MLTCAIPIMMTHVTHRAAHDDLVRQGYPMVVVETWHEVTKENLELWWAKLSPLLPDARWMLLAEIWATYVIHPCPGTIQTFLAHLKAGTCPEYHDPATCPTMNHETKADYACLFDNKGWCPGARRHAPTGRWPGE